MSRDGFDTFDMADHYGSAEIIAGRLLARHAGAGRRPVAMTKWCPEPGPMTADIVRAGVTERLTRLGVEKVDLLQFHWWSFEHPAWLDALHEMAQLKDEGLIGAIGVTNFDAAHLALALADGVPVATNQVSFSLVDRRAAGALSDLCATHRRKALRLWHAVRRLPLGKMARPARTRLHARLEPLEIQALHRHRRRLGRLPGHSCGRRCDRPQARRLDLQRRDPLGARSPRRRRRHRRRAHRRKRAPRRQPQGLFLLRSTTTTARGSTKPLPATSMIPGDCGDEYRRPPYLTASGDLSHHLAAMPSVYSATPDPVRPDRLRVSSGSVWEPLAGFSRAVRVKDTIRVSGTTATHGLDRCVAPGDAGAQTTYILDKIAAAISALGGSLDDVVRTRIYLRDVAQWEPVSRAHGRVFGDIRPANTLAAGGCAGRRLRGRDRGRGGGFDVAQLIGAGQVLRIFLEEPALGPEDLEFEVELLERFDLCIRGQQALDRIAHHADGEIGQSLFRRAVDRVANAVSMRPPMAPPFLASATSSCAIRPVLPPIRRAGPVAATACRRSRPSRGCPHGSRSRSGRSWRFR